MRERETDNTRDRERQVFGLMEEFVRRQVETVEGSRCMSRPVN